MTTLTITARDLRDLLEPVLPFAGKDDMLPVLAGVMIQADGHTVTATTTDRFRLAICRHISTVKVPKFEALIRTKDLRRVLTLFRANRFDNPTLRMAFNGKSLKVSTTEGFGGITGASLTFDYLNGEFPRAWSVIRDALNSGEPRADIFGLNPAFLADFKAASRVAREPLVFRTGAGAGKPLIVMAGDHFIGALMPRRTVSASAGSEEAAYAETARGWLPLLGEPQQKAAAKKPAAPRKSAASKKAALS